MQAPHPVERGSGRPLRVGVLGASGAAGTELVQLLHRHPGVVLSFATSRGHAGHSLRSIDPASADITLRHPDDVAPSDVDVAFASLPHGASATTVERFVDAGARVVDLSGDFRLQHPPTHKRIYGSPRSEELAKEVVYGLSEFAQKELPAARVVANPGCYPTCSALALQPAAVRGLLHGPVVINAVSGVSGAGRAPSAKTHFCAAFDDVRPYSVGATHRHVAEIEQQLTRWTGSDANPVIFNPHLVPIERGMLVTITVGLLSITPAELHDIYVRQYSRNAFVDVLALGEHARIRAVSRTNRAVIGISPGHPKTRHVVLTCAIDNLLKGAAGQAVQNLNAMFGMPEQSGLTL